MSENMECDKSADWLKKYMEREAAGEYKCKWCTRAYRDHHIRIAHAKNAHYHEYCDWRLQEPGRVVHETERAKQVGELPAVLKKRIDLIHTTAFNSSSEDELVAIRHLEVVQMLTKAAEDLAIISQNVSSTDMGQTIAAIDRIRDARVAFEAAVMLKR